MHTFDMVVVGSGGGCDETNLSRCVAVHTESLPSLIGVNSYLIKPATAAWTDGIIGIEGGAHPIPAMPSQLLTPITRLGNGRAAADPRAQPEALRRAQALHRRGDLLPRTVRSPSLPIVVGAMLKARTRQMLPYLAWPFRPH